MALIAWDFISVYNVFYKPFRQNKPKLPEAVKIQSFANI